MLALGSNVSQNCVRSLESNGRLVKATEKFSKDAAHWNKTHFGNVFNRKKNIMERLNGIQRTISIKPSSFLLNLERKLQGELDMVLKQEEEI